MNWKHNRLDRQSVFVLFTVDTEPDDQWSNHRGTSARNVDCLPRFQNELDKLKIVPTYLMTHSVATNDEAIQTLRYLHRNHQCELGAHLHVWDNPPFLPNETDRRYPAFAHELPDKLFQAKLAALTERITENFPTPTAYRAGKFGFCSRHISILESLGYRVDTSVTPLLNRRAKIGIPIRHGGLGGRDYRSAPLDPYHPDYDCETRSGSADLLEVPLTAAIDGPLASVTRACALRGPSWMAQSLAKLRLSRVITASPVQFSAAELIRMVESALGAGQRVFNFTLHSSETMAGGSPVIRSEDDVQALNFRIRSAILYLQNHANVVSGGLTTLAHCCAAAQLRRFDGTATPAFLPS